MEPKAEPLPEISRRVYKTGNEEQRQIKHLLCICFIWRCFLYHRIRVSKDTLINICFCLYLENLTRIELGFALELFDSHSTDDFLCCFYPTSIWGTQLSKLLI